MNANNNNKRNSKREILFQNFQKLVDGVDEYGYEWHYISKEIFNDSIPPNKLRLRYENAVKRFGAHSHFWTTKETKKLIDAVAMLGENWETISSEIFKFQRSPIQCQFKWERVTYGKLSTPIRRHPPRDFSTSDHPPASHSRYQHPPTYKRPLQFKYPRNNPREYNSSRGDYISLDSLPLRNRKYDNLFENFYKEWTNDDTHTLIKAVSEHGKNWALISERYYSRSQSALNLKLKWTKLVSSKHFNE